MRPDVTPFHHAPASNVARIKASLPTNPDNGGTPASENTGIMERAAT